MNILNAAVRFSLAHKNAVWALVCVWTAAGLYAGYHLPIDAVPDVTPVQVQIVTSSPSLSPTEVEQYITVPVEKAMAGIPHMTEIRSLSKYGISLVTLVFQDNTSIQEARLYVGEKLREVQQNIPSSYGKPGIAPMTSGLGEIYQFTLQSPQHSLQQLKELLDWEIIPALRMVPGVVEVNSFGGETKEYQIHIQSNTLQSLGLSITDVANALKKNNANTGGGYLEHNGEHWVIGSQGLITSIEDLKSVVITTSLEGSVVTLADIAQVHTGAQLRRGSASMDGEGEVVVGTVMMLTHANAHEVTQQLKKTFANLEKSLPQGVRIRAFYDRSLLVNRALKTVFKNLAEGAALVIAVLLFLLGDFKAGLIVASVIPLAMLFTLLCMSFFGISGNLMSLGAIDFGLIVDAAVIIVENVIARGSVCLKNLGRSFTREEKDDLVYTSTCEVRNASIFGECIIALVYIPVLLLRGMEGKLFQPMAFTVLFALLGALILSLTWVPALCAVFLQPHQEKKPTWAMQKTDSFYQKTIGYAFKNRTKVLVATWSVVCVSGVVLYHMGSEFIPHINEGDMLVEARRFTGTALSSSIITDQRMQKALLNIPEIAHAVSKTGAPDLAVDPMGLEQTDVYIQLKDENTWTSQRTREEVGEEIIKVLEKETPEAAVSLSQPIQMRTNELSAGIRSDVGIEIYGHDFKTLESLSKQVSDALLKIPGVADIKIEQGAGLGYLSIIPKRTQLALHGLNIEDINTWVESASVGHGCGDVFENNRRFHMVLKTPFLTPSVESFASVPLHSPKGYAVALGDVAEIVLKEGPASINRSQQSRRRLVEFNIRNRDLMSVVLEAQKHVKEKVSLPEGYKIVWGGEYTHLVSAGNRLAYVIPLTLLSVVCVLMWAFKKMLPVFLIILNIPCALVGGIAALAARQMPLSISAGIGFIALVGISVLNGLVLVSYIMAEKKLHPILTIQDHIRIAQQRLRPILMTASVAALGFIPMALSQSAGSEIQRPLATVVVGGVVSCTLLTLVLLPLLHHWMDRHAH
jgi:cobalt-zinc-cadmium resistance protein CzcA